MVLAEAEGAGHLPQPLRLQVLRRQLGDDGVLGLAEAIAQGGAAPVERGRSTRFSGSTAETPPW
jgi:hypothetical protein